MLKWLAAVVVAGSVITGDLYPLWWVLMFFALHTSVVLVVGTVGTPRFPYGAWQYRPFVSILVPARNEESVIEGTVRSLAGLDYLCDGRPGFEIIVIDDASTDGTPGVLERLTREIEVLRVVRRPAGSTGGKAAALNEGLRHARGDIIAVFDADTRVKPGFLRYPMLYLADPRVAGVQTGVRVYNARENWLTRMQDSEFAIFCGYYQKVRTLLGGFVGLGGNGQLVKAQPLRRVGGWRPGTLTEDLDLSVRLLLAGYRVAFCPEAELRQEAVTTLGAFIRQRTRWSQGNLQTALRYFRPIRRSRLPWFRKWDALLYLSGSAQTVLVFVSAFAAGAGWLWPGHIRHAPSAWMLALPMCVYAAFIAVAHVQAVGGRAREILLRLLLYGVYQWLWAPTVAWAAMQYAWRRGRVTWEKTVHRGTGTGVGVGMGGGGWPLHTGGRMQG
ncbi:glycosyltransferase [Alicyclobacillus sp.]|uniref:glycosyltransferase n=1 Tax=Alicyclobacillus sp. TaxID=61169 RepID=UPI0025BED454|nr:glycosyltransferase [Alicyclobacillus sp.]MCL6515922.1 glycosyltransferase family 2 protein [Alicyclobacillus sp.]